MALVTLLCIAMFSLLIQMEQYAKQMRFCLLTHVLGLNIACKQ